MQNVCPHKYRSRKYRSFGKLFTAKPSLAHTEQWPRRWRKSFLTFEIEHTLRNENRFADALATLGSQIIFEGDSTRIEVSKRKEFIIKVFKERFREEQCEGDWRIPIREVLMRGEGAVELKILKDYALVRKELYRRMPGGVLSKCIGQ